MDKLKLVPDFFRATRLRHWPRLIWYLFAWGLWRLLHLKVSGEQTLTFRTFRVVVDPTGLGGLVFLHEILIRKVYDVEPLRNDAGIHVIFDVGANCGFFTLCQSAARPDFTIYAFEPHPATFKHLERNIVANNLQNVVPIHAAVGSASGSCNINVSAESSMAIVSTSKIQFLEAPKAVEVPLLSLDDFARTRQVKPDFMKIDVEGFEAEVLRGASECLKHSRGVILEYHSEVLKSECTRLLEEAEFKVTPSPPYSLLAVKQTLAPGFPRECEKFPNRAKHLFDGNTSH